MFGCSCKWINQWKRWICNSIKNYSSVEDNIAYYKRLTSSYPIKSIEDPFAEEDWHSWKKITNEIGKNVQIVGDDLFVTNTKRLTKGIKEKSANSILVKPNQIGTLTETLDVISIAKEANFNIIVSHRSGDTEDTFIADLAERQCLHKSNWIVSKIRRVLNITDYCALKKNLAIKLKWLKSSLCD